jgi:hypothetical protein
LNRIDIKAPTNVDQSNTRENNSEPIATTRVNINSATTKPPSHQSFFSNVFDRLWNDDDEDDDRDEDENNDYKFPPPIPFSLSSHFPFLHLRWPDFDNRKKRSLEAEPKSRKPRDLGHRDKRRLFGRGAEGDTKRPHYTGDDLEMVWDVISDGKTSARPKKTTHVFQQRIMGIEVKGDLEHEVRVVTTKDEKNEWVIRLSLLLNVGEHRFKVLSKTYTMKELEERFIKHSKPKFEYGTVHAGTLVSETLAFKLFQKRFLKTAPGSLAPLHLCRFNNLTFLKI